VPKNYFDARIAAGYERTRPTCSIPLSRRGVQVHGIELSPAMLEQLRAKSGSDDIGVTIGDFATAQVGDTINLAYHVYNTITNLTT